MPRQRGMCRAAKTNETRTKKLIILNANGCIHWVTLHCSATRRRKSNGRMAADITRINTYIAVTLTSEILGHIQKESSQPNSSEFNGVQKCAITGTCSRLGDRAFTAAGPRLWNSLPTQCHVRRLDLSLDTFLRKTKTYLIVRATSA